MKEGRQFSGRQSQGARDYQEDSWGWHNRRPEGDDSPTGLLVVLADGMGGHKGGAHASAVAVDTFIESFAESEGEAARRLETALDKANDRIRLDSSNDADLAGMGCTLVAVNIGRDGMQWISVGDSPLWLLRSGALRRLNEDHSMAPLIQLQVEKGDLTEEEAVDHPQRNALRSAVIGDTIELVDLAESPMALMPSDRIILASDGLETLTVEEISDVAAEDPNADSEAIATKLVAAVDAKQWRGQDNVTVVVVSPYVGVRDSTLLVGRSKNKRARSRPKLLLLGLVVAALVLWVLLGTGKAQEEHAGQGALPIAPAAGDR